jgi:hypothetical protein
MAGGALAEDIRYPPGRAGLRRNGSRCVVAFRLKCYSLTLPERQGGIFRKLKGFYTDLASPLDRPLVTLIPTKQPFFLNYCKILAKPKTKKRTYFPIV